jgi:NACHT domain
MAKRSLQASPEGAKLARKIFDRRGWTQEGLATELDLRTRQPIWRFFTCRPIERYIFIELCSILDLNWWEIADNPPEPLIPKEEQKQPIGAAQLGSQVRLKHQERIEHQCRLLRVLGTSFPVPMENLFVSPNLLSQLVSQEHLDASELEQHYAHSFSRSPLSRLTTSMISASDALVSHLHIRISGKPGSGKTTLLKWMALQCQQDVLYPDLVPIFIKLGHYAEEPSSSNDFNLLSCIQQELRSSGIDEPQIVETLAREGKLLLLIDELDEIPSHSRSQITREISRFLDHFYKARTIIVSRLAQQFEFPQFVSYELADLNDNQIETLTKNWFNVFDQSSEHQAEALMQQLKAPGNHRIYELAQVPLLLSRICQVFQAKGQLLEIRDKIYEECFVLLVKEWGESKGISSIHTETKISTNVLHYLGELSVLVLQSQGIFFERSVLEHNQHLEEASYCSSIHFYKNLLNSQSSHQTNATLSDSAIFHGLIVEQAKGIFSFAYLAIEEYFVAWHIVTSPDLEQTMTELIDCISEPRWHEVFFIICSMLQNKAMLLQPMQRQVESLVIQRPDLANFLRKLKQRGDQFLLWQQADEIYILLDQLARTPQILAHLAIPINHFKITAQHLLLQIVLGGLQLWNLLPGSNSTEADSMLNYLIDQALLITTSLGYRDFFGVFLELKELFQSSLDSQQKRQKRQPLIELAASKWALMSGQEPLIFDQIQVLQSDLSVLQLFLSCILKTEINASCFRIKSFNIVSDINLVALNQVSRLQFIKDEEPLFHPSHYHWLNLLLLYGFSPTAQNFLDKAYHQQNTLISLKFDRTVSNFHS